jgi:hypothetical protein
MRFASYLLTTGAVLRSRRPWVNGGVKLPTCCKQASLTMPAVSKLVSSVTLTRVQQQSNFTEFDSVLFRWGRASRHCNPAAAILLSWVCVPSIRRRMAEGIDIPIVNPFPI